MAPASHRRAPRRAVHRSSPRSPAPPPPPKLERESLESLRDDFDEATLHVAQRREYTGFRIGPVVVVPPVELETGVIGWRRRIDWSPTPTGALGAEPDAWLYLLVGAGDRGLLVVDGSPGAAAPMVRVACATSPRSVLIARPRSEVEEPLLERLATATCAEMESGD